VSIVVLHRPYRGFTQKANVVLHRESAVDNSVVYRGFTQRLTWFYTDSIVVSHTMGIFYTVIL